MKVWTLTVLNHIENNYQGIDDIEIYIYDSKNKAINSFINRNLKAINDIKAWGECKFEDLEITEFKYLFQCENGRDCISTKITEREVL